MKRVVLSLGIIVASAAYALLGSEGSTAIMPSSPGIAAAPPPSSSSVTSSQTTTPAGGPNPSPAPSTAPSPTPAPSPAPTPSPTPTPAPAPAPAPTPAPKPQGQYVDGTYVGSVADAYYGNVQVQAIIRNGAIADVQFLQYPNTHSTSIYINSQAMPYLTQEAIQAQSANVNIVSGATDTSQAFRQSLSAALAKAKA